MTASADSWVTTERVLAAIKEYLVGRQQSHFTTVAIAEHMGADEYSVRRAFGWLKTDGLIDVVPCVSSVRYTRTRGEKYSVAVYEVMEAFGPPDLAALHRTFCCGRGG